MAAILGKKTIGRVLVQIGENEPIEIGTVDLSFEAENTAPPRADQSGRGAHFLAEDHNGDPVCRCGWDPARALPCAPVSRESARSDIREHIGNAKQE
ncbi:hypothetical protein [Arthrobacter sp. PsM3]|uniref:hypothetical protein n=1 Tax=Arthrobacter sp. PsM3 TaxID=3030531 RepID=UPI00263A84C5|nr:hypothetical protein [Arthrobacter sp. PsM3]MDN4645372.1 hypothetical protein [Arthrobacter sp. PsM3]